MDKNARKPSSDTDQEQLRQHKDSWNKQVSGFISLLIALKKGMNGREVSELDIPKGSIKEPLPPSVSRLLEELSNVYSKLTEEGKQIVQEQSNYSESRRKSVSREAMITEASNPFSRFLTHVTTPFRFKDKSRWNKLKLLRNLSSIQKELKKLEDKALSTKYDEIPELVYRSKNLFEIMDTEFLSPLKEIYNDLPLEEEAVKPKEKPKKIEDPDKPEDLNKDQDIDDYEKLSFMKSDLKDKLQSVTDIQMNLNKVSNPEQREYINNLIDIMNRGVPWFMAQTPEKYSIKELELAYEKINEAYEALSSSYLQHKESLFIGGGIEKVAVNVLTRAVYRKWLEIFKRQGSSLKVKISQDIENSLKNIDDIMNSLEERGAIGSKIKRNLNLLLDNLSSMYLYVYKLGQIYNNRLRMDKAKAKMHKKTISKDFIRETDLNYLKRISGELKSIKV